MTDIRLASGQNTTVTLSKKGKYFDFSMLVIVLFLVAFGLIMVYSTSSYSAVKDFNDSTHYFKRQFVASLGGIVFMFIACLINYHVWQKFAGIIYALSIFSVILILSPMGYSANGARRWINLGFTTIQPAEIVKLGIIIALAAFICYSGKKMRDVRNNLFYIGMTVVAAGLIFFITNNLSSAIIIVGIAYVMLLVSNPKPTWLIIMTIVGAVLITIFLVLFFKSASSGTSLGFRFKRLLAWRDPESYASSFGYQTLQALYAIGSGGFFGKGLGQSIQKLGFIPEAQNDMIFSVVCEELGLFGGICLIILFILLIWRLMVIANNAPDLFGSMLVVGVMAHIAIQVILNVAVVTNSIPNTGISLPFISYGGSSVMFLLIEMGIVLNVSKQIQIPVAVKKR